MNRRLAIVAIVCGLFGIAACGLLLNPGRFGMTPAAPPENGEIR